MTSPRRDWLRGHIGRRGVALVLFSLFFVITGLGAIVDPVVDEGRFVLYAILPVPVRAALWLVPAALGLWAAFRSTGRDAVAFGALVVPVSVIAFSYVWSWVGSLAGLTAEPLGWTHSAKWLLMLALILLVSGWKEAEEPSTSTTSTPTGGPRA